MILSYQLRALWQLNKNKGLHNKSLINRGSITFWVSEDSINNWHISCSAKKKGRPFVYADEAILCALTVKAIYDLPFRSSIDRDIEEGRLARPMRIVA